jgi:hypothetical protein
MQDSSSASGTDSEGESAFATGTMSIPSMLGGEGDTSARSRSDSASDEISSKKRRTALELAIEAGDWEAVGEAAAMMSDASVTSASTGEINRIADQGDASTFSGDSKDNRYRINAERAAELDDMIDRGDWTGVVAAASRFSAGDSSSSPTAQDAPASTEGLGSAYAAASGRATEGSAMEGDREQRLKEEQEALAQAEIWMAIAEQSKQEGSTGKWRLSLLLCSFPLDCSHFWSPIQRLPVPATQQTGLLQEVYLRYGVLKRRENWKERTLSPTQKIVQMLTRVYNFYAVQHFLCNVNYYD